jgi:hypothetical protein
MSICICVGESVAQIKMDDPETTAQNRISKSSIKWSEISRPAT